jgi:hypothetical protein
MVAIGRSVISYNTYATKSMAIVDSATGVRGAKCLCFRVKYAIRY